MEDLKLGLDFALAGNSPIFCPSARVTSDFPFSVEGVQSQRLRWEQGHIGMILTTAPRLIFPAIVQANLDLLALAFDASGSTAFFARNAGDGDVGGRRFGDIARYFFRSDICQFSKPRGIHRWRLHFLAEVWS